jgi:hypothetical protein
MNALWTGVVGKALVSGVIGGGIAAAVVAAGVATYSAVSTDEAAVPDANAVTYADE